jgi:hypothetical protein
MENAPETVPVEQLIEAGGEFGYVARLAIEASERTNHLSVPHAHLTSKSGKYMGVLVAAHSDLIAEGNALQHDPYARDGIVVHETTHREMRAVATMVGLWPYANEGNGDATIFQVDTTYTPQAEQAVMPLAELALQLYGIPGQAANAFDATTHARHGDGHIFATYEEPLFVFATDQTRFEPIVAGRQEITHEVGIKAALTGRAQVWLGRQGLVRIKDSSIYNVDSSMRMAEIILPEDGSVESDTVVVAESPTDAYGELFTRNDQGYIVVASSKDTSHDQITTNPKIPLDGVAGMLTEPILWADVTDTFLKPYDSKKKAAALLSLGLPGQRLDTLFAGARDALLAAQQAGSAKSTISGNILVAAMVQALPGRRDMKAVGDKYYNF